MKNLANIFKKVENQKGFSLVELLIVIAIMGVLAVLAFNSFSGVLSNSKKKADQQQAKNIEKAVKLLTAESGTLDITTSNKFYKKSGAAYTAISNFTANQAGLENLVIALQDVIYSDDMIGQKKALGPYLDNPTGSATATFTPYSPQWIATNGGAHTGYLLLVRKSNNTIACVPVTGAAGGAPSTSLEDTGVPGISIVN